MGGGWRGEDASMVMIKWFALEVITFGCVMNVSLVRWEQCGIGRGKIPCIISCRD